MSSPATSPLPENPTAGQTGGDDTTQTNGDDAQSGEGGEDGEQGQNLTLRALVSTKEAGVIIGKGGKNVADLRELTGVKAGVSKVVQGVNDRVLSVSGNLEGVAWAYSEIARQLLETPLSTDSLPPPPPNAFTSVRLLISHNLMGTVIGRSGLKIKHIQDVSGARMVASKEMLPQSTERVVEVQGTTDAIKVAVSEIGRCLIDDWERGQGTVLYHPGASGDAGVLAGGGASAPGVVVGRRPSAGFAGAFPPAAGGAPRRTSVAQNGGEAAFKQQSTPAAAAAPAGTPAAAAPVDGSLRTQNISIPSDMVGCIIGRAGSKITEIRRLSGSKISIAKVPHDETGERMFTIVGSPESNEKALFLLYNQLESEKTRRVEGAEQGADE
ncbi:hypothetical protein BDY24DRAFT_132539 [Mrakia frigida]|uniref:KH domain-containing protein n=1 Tax=Mrakia frigida TaxID=29902 RepID=UPI003FCC06DB